MAEEQSDVMYCTVHPKTETNLRCNKCGRPMCTKCMVRTPVGYRCKECIYEQQNVFYTAEQRDYVVAGALGVGAGLVAGLILTFIGSYGLWFALVAGVPMGFGIGELLFRAAGRRRGRKMWLIGAGMVLLGAVAPLVIRAASAFGALGAQGVLYTLAGPLIAIAIMMGGVVQRLR
jgi:hypothetical protein